MSDDCGIDWSLFTPDKPCEALAVVWPAYLKLLAGEREIWIGYGDRQVRYAGDQIKLKEFKQAIDELEQKCAIAKAALEGKRSRFAIAAGYRR